MSEHQRKVMEVFEGDPYLRARVQECLGKEITLFTLKGRGACNSAYYIETKDGGKYIVKQEREQKEFQPQNSLLVEAAVARQLSESHLSVPVPRVVFTLEHPCLYGYEYVEGTMLKDVWGTLSEELRVDICRKLGSFHAEIGSKITKEMSQHLGVKIDDSSGLHPEVLKEYVELISAEDVPDRLKRLAQRAKEQFDRTSDRSVFQFLHNDAHHENILIKDEKISGIIDFGNAEYGETAREFSRYIRDFPHYFQHIVSAYEETSGHRLSYARLVSNAYLSGFMEIVEEYRKEGKDRLNAEKMVSDYEKLMDTKSIYP